MSLKRGFIYSKSYYWLVYKYIVYETGYTEQKLLLTTIIHFHGQFNVDGKTVQISKLQLTELSNFTAGEG